MTTKSKSKTTEISLSEAIAELLLGPRGRWDEELVRLMKHGNCFWEVRAILSRKADPDILKNFKNRFDAYFFNRERARQGIDQAHLPEVLRSELQAFLDSGHVISDFFEKNPALGFPRDWDLSEFVKEK